MNTTTGVGLSDLALPEVEDVPLVRAVLDVGVCRLDPWLGFLGVSPGRAKQDQKGHTENETFHHSLLELRFTLALFRA